MLRYDCVFRATDGWLYCGEIDYAVPCVVCVSCWGRRSYVSVLYAGRVNERSLSCHLMRMGVFELRYLLVGLRELF